MQIEEICLEELVECVANSEECNFVGVAITPWHAHGIDCAIEYYSKLYSLNGIICINKHRETGYALGKDNFYNLDKGTFRIVKLVNNTVSTKKFQRKKTVYCIQSYFRKRKGREIITASADHPWISFGTLLSKRLSTIDVKYYVMDEGLATYMTHAKQNVKRSSYNFLKRFVSKIRTEISEQMKYAHLNVVDGKLLRKQRNELLANEQSIIAYKKIIQKGAERVSAEEYSQYANAIIISTQLYNETGDIVDGADISLIHEIYTKLVDNGEKVIIKLHPRTMNYSVYNQSMDIDVRKDFSQEVIFSKLEQLPKAVISFTSTSLVTAKLFWGMPCFSLVDLVDKSKMSNYARIEFEAFKNEFGNIVDIVTDMDSLLNNIKTLV